LELDQIFLNFCLKSLIKIKETVRPKNKIDIEFLKEKLRKITESKKN